MKVSLDTLPAYLRGEGRSDLAEMIEKAGKDSARLKIALQWAETEVEGEPLHVVSSFARIMENAQRIKAGQGYSAGDIADHFKVHRQTVYQWMKRDSFPHPIGQVGNARVWNIDEIETWYRGLDLQPGRPRKSPRSD